MVTATLHYIYDPLCGWCYAASPLLQAAASLPGLDMQLHAGGMMSGSRRQAVTPALREAVKMAVSKPLSKPKHKSKNSGHISRHNGKSPVSMVWIQIIDACDISGTPMIFSSA